MSKSSCLALLLVHLGDFDATVNKRHGKVGLFLNICKNNLKSNIMQTTDISDEDYFIAKSWLVNQFANNVEKYLVNDLKVLNSIPNSIKDQQFLDIFNQSLGYCTVPQAMSIFSFMDFLGYLLREDIESKDDIFDTYRNLEFFLEEYFVKSDYIIENDIKPIIRLYRHGIMHQFLPKGVAIFKPHKEVTSVKGIVNFIGEGQNRMYALNVVILTNCFIEVLKKIMTEFYSDDEEIKFRNYQMFLRWKEIMDEDFQEASQYLPNKRNQIPEGQNTTIVPKELREFYD